MKPREAMARAATWLAAFRAQLPLGRRGERAAEKYLRRHGYRIVTRNFRAAGAEIDLIAMDGDTLVFVEVKTRRNRAAGAPEEAVDARKQSRMRRAAEVLPSAILRATPRCDSTSSRWTHRASGWRLNC